MPRPAKPKLRKFEVVWRSAVIWRVDAEDEIQAQQFAEKATGQLAEELEIREQVKP